MEVAHIDAWRANPERFWRFYGDRFAALQDKRPNGAHAALVELERRGHLDAVVTQNIDRLHRRAGTTRLVEVHGTIDHSSCLACGAARAARRRARAAGRGAATASRAATCGAPLKPDVVLFGEFLPEGALQEAYALAAGADVLLCVGSSLEVHPIAQLPGVTRANGGAVAVVTAGPDALGRPGGRAPRRRRRRRAARPARRPGPSGVASARAGRRPRGAG